MLLVHCVRAKLIFFFGSELWVYNHTDPLNVLHLIQGDLGGVGVLPVPYTAAGKVVPSDFELAISPFKSVVRSI